MPWPRAGTYYTFSYVLDGTLSMYLGTQDPTYLKRVLAWSETMVAQATVVDSNGDRNWAGPWASPYSATSISYHLDDMQGTPPLAKLARVIKTDSALNSTYGARADPILAFVKNDIVDKWDKHRNASSWYHDNANDMTVPYNDKIALDLKILTEVYEIDGSYQATIPVPASRPGGVPASMPALASAVGGWEASIPGRAPPSANGWMITSLHPRAASTSPVTGRNACADMRTPPRTRRIARSAEYTLGMCSPDTSLRDSHAHRWWAGGGECRGHRAATAPAAPRGTCRATRTTRRACRT
jgi:hypothetical protein